MKTIIHIFGASGSGTSTFAKYIAAHHDYHFMDTDDYFWENTSIPFTVKRSESDRIKLMKEEFERYPKTVLSGSLCGWGDELIPYFDVVIELIVPTEIRLERIQKREHERFGKRIELGGDMYQNHKDFMEWAGNFDTFGLEHRSRAMHDAWKKKLSCTVLTLDGTRLIEDLYQEIEQYL